MCERAPTSFSLIAVRFSRFVSDFVGKVGGALREKEPIAVVVAYGILVEICGVKDPPSPSRSRSKKKSDKKIIEPKAVCPGERLVKKNRQRRRKIAF